MGVGGGKVETTVVVVGLAALDVMCFINKCCNLAIQMRIIKTFSKTYNSYLINRRISALSNF